MLLSAIITCTYSQPKFEAGIIIEGSSLSKGELNKEFGYFKARINWGTGIGGYVVVPIWRRISLSSGCIYRYTKLQKGDPIWLPADKEHPWGSLTGNYNWGIFSRNYILVPLALRVHLSKNFYVSAGAETCYLLGYSEVKNRPEYNKAFGFGSRRHRLNWEFLYIVGLKEQLAANYDAQGRAGATDYFKYKTNMMQLSLSYPLWERKHNK